jgi:hypothetical protein
MTMSLFYLFLGPLTRMMADVAHAQIAELDAATERPLLPNPASPVAATAA